MNTQRPVIVWFRQDLRLADNPALTAAADTGAPIVPVYILDDHNAGEWKMGAASRWWLHASLEALHAALEGKLQFHRGPAEVVLPQLVRQLDASHVFWNRCYEPWRINRDRRIKRELRDDGRLVSSKNGSLLFEPHSISKPDGTPYMVFTPYFRKGCLNGANTPRDSLPVPQALRLADSEQGGTLDELALLPAIRWYDEMAAEWSPGEAGAQQRLARFLNHGLQNYKAGRNRPDQAFVSRLSPHLHFGELSPHQAWHASASFSHETPANVDHFQSELGWREFSYYLIYQEPQLPRQNLQAKFNRFPWRKDPAALRQWQRGETGYPVVDAGMRELWRTGYMHNRVRMIVASFLTKNLLLHWHDGEDWFWDCLLDADLANNSASWQWVAGCGADAATYFRIFNPVLQGRKFDPDGDYVRRYVPELSALPPEFMHAPWEAPADVLHKAGVALGDHYPWPMVDLEASRKRAQAAYERVQAS